MKKLTLLMSFLALAITVQAQEFEHEMAKTVASMATAETVEEFQNVANRFERIGSVNRAEWLPHYYVAYLYTKMSYLIDESQKRDAYLSRAEKEYNVFKTMPQSNGIETKIVYAYILQAKFSVDYMARIGQLKESLKLLKSVVEESPENPRANLLLGISYYNMPGFMGGDKKKASAYPRKAQECFSRDTVVDNIYPNWGQDICEYWIEKISGKED
jgi:tetratricopeptide (TPR) repeat protein